VLDVQQIFGRAGRPQFDSFGEAYILTPVNKLPHYITALTTQVCLFAFISKSFLTFFLYQTPIESQFIKNLADHLNAEVSLGTVANVPPLLCLLIRIHTIALWGGLGGRCRAVA
jgi:activating signal cointegrator complex subunit 3